MKLHPFWANVLLWVVFAVLGVGAVLVTKLGHGRLVFYALVVVVAVITLGVLVDLARLAAGGWEWFFHARHGRFRFRGQRLQRVEVGPEFEAEKARALAALASAEAEAQRALNRLRKIALDEPGADKRVGAIFEAEQAVLRTRDALEEAKVVHSWATSDRGVFVRDADYSWRQVYGPWIIALGVLVLVGFALILLLS